MNDTPVMLIFSTLVHVSERERESQAIVAPGEVMEKSSVSLEAKKSADRRCRPGCNNRTTSELWLQWVGDILFKGEADFAG